MDLSFAELREEVAAADAAVPVGSRTQWGVGGSAAAGVDVRVPAGILAHEPGDLTVTVAGGTAVAELKEALAEHGQECPLDTRDPAATVGGVLACGLSGPRRLRHGPIRDCVLEVRFATADGRLVKGGGPTVKNVSGYDLPRLLVGSLGTLGVIAQATLRCQPLAPTARWATAEGGPSDLLRTLFRPSCVAWDGVRVSCLLEGHPADLDAELAGAGLEPADGPPAWPDGPYRGRISVRPRAVRELGDALGAVAGLRWLAEAGVGTVHVAADAARPVEDARRLAAERGGWLLREEGEELEPFGPALPNAGVMRRLKEALDPAGKLNPGRLPL